MKNIDEQLEVIKYGASEIIQEDELIKKLKSGKRLIVKAGLDRYASWAYSCIK